MQWSGASEYASADRAIWTSPNATGVSGYVRRAKNFARAVVRSAGHIVPYDQPWRALDMFLRFKDGKLPFFAE